MLREKVRHRDGRVHLDPPAIVAELRRLDAAGHEDDPELPAAADRPARAALAQLVDAQRQAAHARRAHARRCACTPTTPRRIGLADGDTARVASKSGAVEVPVLVTDEMTPGTVALPHGWGHRGGWSLANAAGGVNVNLLSSAEPEDLEPLAGMAFLNGIPVSLEPVASAAPAPSPRAAAVPAASPRSAA